MQKVNKLGWKKQVMHMYPGEEGNGSCMKTAGRRKATNVWYGDFAIAAGSNRDSE